MENEHYWKGRYEEVTRYRDQFIEEIHKGDKEYNLKHEKSTAQLNKGLKDSR